MAARGGLFIFALILAWPLNSDFHSQLIVWNVGQGQWVTLVEEHICWHFDSGGERAPWGALMKECRQRRNVVTFSHWDWDHISFAAQLPSRLGEVCVLYPPSGEGSWRKKKTLSRLLACEGLAAPFPSWVNPDGHSANDKSRVALWKDILIPGDSTSAQEKFWIDAFPKLSSAKILILGHHGSRTSTSKRLLDRLQLLNVAVSSARRRKYGHPHFQVEEELRRRHVPLLRTEVWGSLRFEL